MHDCAILILWWITLAHRYLGTQLHHHSAQVTELTHTFVLLSLKENGEL